MTGFSIGDLEPGEAVQIDATIKPWLSLIGAVFSVVGCRSKIPAWMLKSGVEVEVTRTREAVIK